MSAPRRPNVLLLHCHDLGQHLGAYGIPAVHTPHLDRLAGRGVLLENHFATAPQCSPSRAALFTGRYPHNTGVLGLTHADFGWDLNPDALHLAQILKRNGYATHAVGVLHETRSGHARCGFETHAPAAPADRVARETVSLLQKLATSPTPFYVQAGCLEPHRLPGKQRDDDQGFLGDRLAPDTSKGVFVPPYLRDTPGTRQEMAELQGAVRHLDTEMGRILDALERLELDRSTVVVFTTDHGIAMPRAKCSLYEPGLRTACILRHPDRPGWSQGSRFGEMVANIDVLPTLLDLVGIPVPDTVQGRSFAPLVDGGAYTPRTEIFGEMTYHDYYDPRRSVRTRTHKLIANFTTAPSFMDPSQSWRPRSDTSTPKNHALSYHRPVELYDLEKDPWEQVDLAADPAHAPVLGSLQRLLRQHLRATDDPILDGAVTSPMHRRTAAWLDG